MKIPKNKLEFLKNKIKRDCPSCEGSGCSTCNSKVSRAVRYAKAEIPIDYWNLSMKDFKGDSNFGKIMKEKIRDTEGLYERGESIALIGNLGVGKSYAACALLKMALMKGLTVKYAIMSDIINKILSHEDDYLKSIINIDFLCIDEYDKRWVFPSEKSEQIFGQTMEYILRSRFSNGMPTVICSNTRKLEDVLSDNFSKPLESLMSKYMEIIYVSGKDFRKNKKDFR